MPATTRRLQNSTGGIIGALSHTSGVLLEDADALAEETFLRVARTKAKGEGRFDPSECSFKTWLYRIARNRAIDHWRRQQRDIRVAEGAGEGEEQGQSPVEQVPSADPTPEELLVAQTFSEPVHACLAGRTLLPREVLLLTDVEGFGLSEIAVMLEVPGYPLKAGHQMPLWFQASRVVTLR